MDWGKIQKHIAEKSNFLIETPGKNYFRAVEAFFTIQERPGQLSFEPIINPENKQLFIRTPDTLLAEDVSKIIDQNLNYGKAIVCLHLIVPIQSSMISPEHFLESAIQE